ncbi:MAG: WxcM-like domain-containing protein [Nodosilinea sp. LVE1205-7]|jgi:dTDP-4-dehydrorhamnose 3,5-epimerase-like enzyme
MLEIQKITSYINQSDQRGEFLGLINRGNWQEINFVKTRAGKVRGSHFHRKTNEVIFLVTGKVDIELCDCNEPDKKTKLLLNAGEGVKITPFIFHTFHYLEDSVHIQLLDIPFDVKNQDLHSLSSIEN